MFEILNKEQVKKMSDRELRLSEDYFFHNWSLIVSEKVKREEQAPRLVEECSVIREEILHEDSEESKLMQRIKTRGKKKKAA